MAVDLSKDFLDRVEWHVSRDQQLYHTISHDGIPTYVCDDHCIPIILKTFLADIFSDLLDH